MLLRLDIQEPSLESFQLTEQRWQQHSELKNCLCFADCTEEFSRYHLSVLWVAICILVVLLIVREDLKVGDKLECTIATQVALCYFVQSTEDTSAIVDTNSD